MIKQFLSYLISLNKYAKGAVIRLNDLLCFAFGWLIFVTLPSFMSKLDVLSTGMIFNFFVPFIIYLIIMQLMNGYKSLARKFNIQILFPLLISVGAFFVSSVLLNIREAVHERAAINSIITSISVSSLSSILLIGTRYLFKSIVDYGGSGSVKKVFIYGFGSSAQELYASLSFDESIKVIGFISNTKDDIDREYLGVKIYSLKGFQKSFSEKDKLSVYIADRTLTTLENNNIVEICITNGFEVKKIPSFSEMLKEKEVLLEDLSISDLIPRTNLDEFHQELTSINNKAVLVTGAGGSIGSEISRLISRNKVSHLILIDISESALFSILNEIKEINQNCKLTGIIQDIKDQDSMDKIFNEFRPDIIYHAAAYKHVPLLETKFNYKAAFYNNFFGTCNLVDLAIKNGISQFIFISTDKAVRPTNIMGSTKRLAEIYLQKKNKENHDTEISSVRFGNVLESSGSVVPIFRNQIKNGGPVSVTHPEITRYFMTISEAAYLVVISSILCKDNKQKGIYMLKMGDPVKIVDIAKRLIKLSGHNVRDEQNKDGIEIIFTGLRPGEKLYEELLVSENDVSTDHQKVFMDTNEIDISNNELEVLSKEIKQYLREDNLQAIKQKLHDLAEYNPTI